MICLIDTHFDGPAVISIFKGVRHQIVYHLVELVTV